MFLAFSTGAIFSDIIDDFLLEKYQFLAIALVTMLDMFFGIWKAFKLNQFETKKTFKGLYMLVAFEFLLAVLLTIEKGFPFAYWISEAVILPILAFELISVLKNMHLIGLIDGTVLATIMKNVDRHKEKEL